MVAEHSACECRYGNDMKLERKRGLAQTNKNRQTKGKPSAQKRNVTHININSKASDYLSEQLNSNVMNSNRIYEQNMQVKTDQAKLNVHN